MSKELREVLTAYRAKNVQDDNELDKIISNFELTPMPFEEQVRAQFAMIILSLSFLDSFVM